MRRESGAVRLSSSMTRPSAAGADAFDAQFGAVDGEQDLEGLRLAHLERQIYELTDGDAEVVELVYVETQIRRDTRRGETNDAYVIR